MFILDLSKQAGIVKKEHIKIHGFWLLSSTLLHSYRTCYVSARDAIQT